MTSKILEGAQEALQIAKGEIAAERLIINGHPYVPEYKFTRVVEALREQIEENCWNAYYRGVERDGMWMDCAISDAEWLQREMGLEPGWHDAKLVKDGIPKVVLKELLRIIRGE